MAAAQLVDGGADAATVGGALGTLLAPPGRRDRVRYVHRTPASAGSTADWPAWAHPQLVEGWRRAGVERPWRHQMEVAELVRAGRHVVVATGTASGKSLSYQLPALTRLLEGGGLLTRPGVLYVSPTKALAADQLCAVTSLGTDVRAAVVDGDTSPEQRQWARQHAGYLLTNPDMLHFSMLPQHARWASFWRGLEVVVVDEMHRYRGVFGAQVAAVLRRVRRVAAHHGASPVFVLASATAADPAATAARLTGLDVVAVQDDTSRRAGTDLVLWEPPTDPAGHRTSTAAETSALLADLVDARVRSLAFVRSRRGAEAVALQAARVLEQREPGSGRLVQAYRGGYLPEERRELEGQLRSGRTVALASTNALELGVDITGLDAVLVSGWPGTRSSLWQQAGRAGRQGTRGLAVLVAADDPLDTYLMAHPEELVGAPVEATVLDPDNPHVLAPHLCAAAAELPVTEADLDLFGPSTGSVLAVLVRRGLLRRRASGWFWTHPTRATDLTDLRGGGGADPVSVVEGSTGRVLGTVDAAAADHSVHLGAVYLHRGSAYEVVALDLEGSTALVRAPAPPWTTHATSVGDIRVLERRERAAWGSVGICLGTVGGHQQGHRVHAAAARLRRGARRAPARPAGADPADHRGVVDAARRRAGGRPGRAGPAARGGARGRALRDRAAPAGGHLRPLGRRRGVDRAAPGHRDGHRVRPRRARRGRGLRRARLAAGAAVADRHARDAARVSLPRRVPVVRAVAEVRQRQRAARQARSGAPARRGAAPGPGGGR